MSWLIARLAGHLEPVRGRIEELLALGADELIVAVAGAERERVLAERENLRPDRLRVHSEQSGLEPVCRCDAAYPRRLLQLASAPRVLYVAGGVERLRELVAEDPVAIVGARRASDYGLEVACALGRGLASARVAVVSGMALGIDSAAHGGALAANGGTIAVLPGGADRPYPRAERALYQQIRRTGVAISELPAGAPVFRWSFPARNRIIAALSSLTIVVEARERSGSLITARIARELERPVAAVPGRVTSPLAAGPNALLAHGAELVRGAQDVLDVLFGAGVRGASTRDRAGVAPELESMLAQVADGADTVATLARDGLTAEQTLAALSALELAGYLRREPGGRYVVVP